MDQVDEKRANHANVGEHEYAAHGERHLGEPLFGVIDVFPVADAGNKRDDGTAKEHADSIGIVVETVVDDGPVLKLVVFRVVVLASTQTSWKLSVELRVVYHRLRGGGRQRRGDSVWSRCVSEWRTKEGQGNLFLAKKEALVGRDVALVEKEVFGQRDLGAKDFCDAKI